MKLSSHSLAVATALFATLVLALAPVAHADTTAPLFGGATLVIHNESFQWQDNATEDEIWHTDTYLNASNQSVTVTGRIAMPALATVSGTDTNGAVNGYLNAGTYHELASQSQSTGSWTFNGHAYIVLTQSMNAAVDLDHGTLSESAAETYLGEGGSFTVSCTNGTGTISGTESGYVVDGVWKLNTAAATTAPGAGNGTYTLFGTSYGWVSGTAATSYNSSGQATSGWTDQYTSTDGGTLTLASDGTAYSVTGLDPYVGSFANSGASLNFTTWQQRTASSFVAAQLWVNGTLVNWHSGTLTSDGVVTDEYLVPGGGLTLTLSGSVRDYALYQAGSATGSPVTVLLNGTNAGTLVQGVFSLTGGVSIQANDPNRNSPLFTSATSLWVNYTEYPFVGGYEDNAGNRTDIYSHSSAGTLTLSGTTSTASSASVTLSYLGDPFTGSYSSGTFTVSGAEVRGTRPPDPVYGPPAFWVRGRFYARSGASANVFTTATGGFTLTLSGFVAASAAASGSDATGSFSGTINADSAGLFALDDGSGNAVPVCAANADGTLRLDNTALPSNLPPALMLAGQAGVWQFLGTLTESGGTTSCYGNAAAADSTDASAGGGCLLKIAASGAVTLCHYLAGTTASGSYSMQTHLFQTGVDNSLPMPLCGVDPNDNDTPWGLATPGNGLATFLVGGEVWRYLGMNGNAALYQGYYGEQQLSLGAANAAGGRVVTVTDPVHGNTTGTLNDVRGGTRLHNGTMVYSGTMNGARAPTAINENNLAAITGNLDIAGNLLSLGSLSGDTAASGVTLQFGDSGGTAMLNTTLGRSTAQWAWWRQSPSDVTARVPVMAVDSAWGLTLYDPANPSTAMIKLNPSGASSFKGALRLTPSSDVIMGEFTNGPQP